MVQGSIEHDLFEELIMIFVTWSSVTEEKVENMVGKSGVMCCIFREVLEEC